jgi:excinuclease UvrABC helicase subunit UvrB
MTADGNGGGDLDPKAVEELRRVARSRPKSGREGGREGERAADVGEIQPGEASGAADDLRFEYAAKLRDEIKSLRHELAEVEASA